MSFLDDLKKEAETKKQHDMESTQTRMRLEEMRMEMVESRLRELYQYLNDLSKQLNDLKLPITRSYYIEGMGDLKLQQGDYKAAIKSVTLDHKDHLKEILFGFKCAEDKTYTIEKDNPSAIERQKDYLWRNGIKFEYAEFKNERGYIYRGVFTVPAIVPVTFQIVGDYDKANITIVTKNFNMLVATEYLYNPEEINTEFMDEFAKFFLDKPSNFLKYGKRLG
ncbi:MAG: hypothetical protein KGZ83_14490 [Sulfuricella sp.]|nr:hypothetical protein [Sulfuricella sp.]